MGTVPLDRPQGATPEEPSPCLAPAQTRQNHHVTIVFDLLLLPSQAGRGGWRPLQRHESPRKPHIHGKGGFYRCC